MSEKNEIARKNVEENEAKNEIIISLKEQQKDLKNILRKIEKMQEFHEINDMTNQIFERRLAGIEEELNRMNHKIKAI